MLQERNEKIEKVRTEFTPNTYMFKMFKNVLGKLFSR